MAKGKKKSANSLDSLKRKFIRMQSPTGFGGARRYESLAYINVPAELGRRDAAYLQMQKYFFEAPFDIPCQERKNLYSRLIKLMDIVVRKTEFIHKADHDEKKSIENTKVLLYHRLVRKFFIVLDQMSDLQNPPDQTNHSLTELFGLLNMGSIEELEATFGRGEAALFEGGKKVFKMAFEQFQLVHKEHVKHFSKEDSERYERAFALYSELYADPDNI